MREYELRQVSRLTSEHDSHKLVCEESTPSLAFHSCRGPDT